jgi:DNA-binding response OmpR family regulator
MAAAVSDDRWPTARRTQVLLLEDNTALARAVRWAVVACSEVTAVVTAAEAMACLDREWDAFVFDIGLPDGSGLDVLRRARREQPDAAALAISGSLRQEDVNAAFAMGAHYLAKPFQPEALVEFLRRAGRRCKNT